MLDAKPPVEPAWASGLERLIWVGVLSAAALLSFDRARRGAYDFRHFYFDADYVWRHGALNPVVEDGDPKTMRQLPFYLPVVPLVLSPIAAGGMLMGAALWAALQTATLAYVLSRVRIWAAAGRSPGHASLTWSLTVGLALPAIYEAVRFNQVTWFTLALLLAGQHALERRRDAWAGAWLAAAAVLKILPLLLGLWLLLKRRWVAAGTMGVAALVIAWAPTVVAFGPEGAWRYHAEWWNYNVTHGGSKRWLTLDEWGPHSEHFVDRRNQSIAAVCGRLFWPGNHVRTIAQPVELTLEQTLMLANGISAGLLLLLLAATRRPEPPRGRAAQSAAEARPATSWMRAEFAAYLIAIQVLAPLARLYYLAWTLPALVLLAWYATPARPGDRPQGMLAGRIGVTLWFIGMAAWPLRPLREVGIHQVMLVGMAACLLAIARQSRPATRPAQTN